MASIAIHNEVKTENGSEVIGTHGTGEWELCFQKVTFNSEGWTGDGFRFIWRRPNGNLQPARGQARLTKVLIFDLMSKASAAGWF